MFKSNVFIPMITLHDIDIVRSYYLKYNSRCLYNKRKDYTCHKTKASDVDTI